MDNDIWLKKQLAKTYKKLRFNFNYGFNSIPSEKCGNELILERIKSGNPFMCARFGAVESRCIDEWLRNKPFSQENINQAYYAAGIFPPTQENLIEFCDIYTNAIRNIDVLGVWSVTGEKKIIQNFCNNSKLIRSRSIEPYYYENPWSKALEGKKVLIIHPFSDSIKKQYEKRKHLFKDKGILPQFKELIVIKAIQSNAGSQTEFNKWADALQYMKDEINKVEFDIAIIGAGAYGLPLAAHVKNIGKISIQMAGATQILFGIKGKRWDSNEIISNLYNDFWIRPSKEETPPEIDKVEGGSYW